MGNGVSTNIPNPLPINRGGTNAQSFAVVNGAVFYDGNKLISSSMIPITKLTVGNIWALNLGIVIATNDANCIVSNVGNTGGMIPEDLPDAFANLGRILIFKDTDGSVVGGGSIQLNPHGTDLIEGQPNYVINTQYGSVTIASVQTSATTATWAIIAKVV